MSRARGFHTPCQEQVYTRVRSIIDELVDEHFDDAEHCDFYFKYGTTLLEISIQPYGDDNAVVRVLAYCVSGVGATEPLHRELLEINAEVPLGAFSAQGNDIYYSHAFLGRHLEPDQLISSLDSVATIADLYDERIVARYGGETALEKLRSITSSPAHRMVAN